MAVFDNLSKEKLFLYPHKIEWIERIPVACKAEAEIVPIEMEEPLKVECRHFLECIENNQKPKTDGEEGLRVLQILQLSQESLSNNGLKLTLNKPHKLYEPNKPDKPNKPNKLFAFFMKNIIITLLIVLLFISYNTQAQEDRPNLITNGSFESLITENEAGGWVVTTRFGMILFDRQDSSHGLISLRLSDSRRTHGGDPNDGYIIIRQRQTLNLENDKAYALSGMVKTENLSNPSGAYVGIINDGWSWIKQFTASTSTGNWERRSISFIPKPSPSYQVVIVLEPDISGKVWFDDLRLEKSDQEANQQNATTTTPSSTTTTTQPSANVSEPPSFPGPIPPGTITLAPTIVQAGFNLTRLTLSSLNGGTLTIGATVVGGKPPLTVEGFINLIDVFGQIAGESIGELKDPDGDHLYELEIPNLPPGALPIGETQPPGFGVIARDSLGLEDAWLSLTIGSPGTGITKDLPTIPLINLVNISSPVPVIYQAGFGLTHLTFSQSKGGKVTIRAVVFGGRSNLNVQALFTALDPRGDSITRVIGTLTNLDGDQVYELNIPVAPGVLPFGRIPMPGLRITAIDSMGQKDTWPTLNIFR